MCGYHKCFRAMKPGLVRSVGVRGRGKRGETRKCFPTETKVSFPKETKVVLKFYINSLKP